MIQNVFFQSNNVKVAFHYDKGKVVKAVLTCQDAIFQLEGPRSLDCKGDKWMREEMRVTDIISCTSPPRIEDNHIDESNGKIDSLADKTRLSSTDVEQQGSSGNHLQDTVLTIIGSFIYVHLYEHYAIC